MIKIKAKQNGKEIKVEFYNKKELLASVTKYENECMVCKKVSVDDADLGEKYICTECLDILKKSIGVEKVSETKKVENVEKPSTRAGYWLSNASIKYVPSIKIVNWIDYKNLLTLSINEKTATMLVEMIIQGINTPIKIAKALGTDRVETIYTYLKAMNKVAMIYTNNGRETRREKKIYKISQYLVYTSI